MFRRVFLSGLLAATAFSGRSFGESFKVYGGMGDGSAVGSSRSGVYDFSDQRLKAADLIKQEVDFNRALPPGSIVINTMARKLYFVLPGNKAWMYPVGVGREGFAWSGRDVITRKAEWPDWRPPPAMIKRESMRGNFLPVMMKGGPGNPLGARALYIGATEYRIHGTSHPSTIGRAVSSGCIRMLNEHVIDLYRVAQVGAQVVVE